MSEYLRKFKKRHAGYFNRGRRILDSSKWHLKSITDFNRKEAFFKAENQAVNQMVGRLSAFIKGAEGERHLREVQAYIDEIVEVVKIHLQKIERYYERNVPEDKWSQTSKQVREIDFQQTLFEGQISVQDKLDRLNIDNDFSELQVTFHKTTKFASIPFREILINGDNIDIIKKIESVDIDWDYIKDNRFFINMRRNEKPIYNSKKHFFDQDKDTLQFYISEWNKIKKGLTIGGYFVHPWLYFHLNYFKTPIPQKDKSQPIINPPLRRNEWYFAEILKKAENENRGAIFIFGSRRYGKSVMEASYLLWKALTTPNSEVSVTISNDGDRVGITDKINTAMTNMHPAFRVTTGKKDWEKIVEICLKDVTGNKMKHCDINIMNLQSGQKRATQKGAGGAPVAYIYDESGKSDFITAYNAAKYSFKTPYGWKTIPIFTGTGANEDITQDAEKVLNDPELYDFLPMDWDLLEYKVPKECITWKRRTFGFFVPGQMGYEDYFAEPDSNMMSFGEFLDIESTELAKIQFWETPWKENTEGILNERKKKEKNRAEYQAQCVFVPLDPEDCLMSAKTNPFPVKEAKATRLRLTESGHEEIGNAKPVFLKRKEADFMKIDYDLVENFTVPNFPFQGGFMEAPILLYEELPEERPPEDLYIAGLDDYKHEKSDGDSVASFVVFNRLTRKIAAAIHSRPDPHHKLHKQIHMLCDAFNCKIFPENEDLAIKTYFDRLHLSHMYLVEGFDVAAKLKFSHTGNRKYGWQPGIHTTPKVIGFALELAKEEVVISDKDGNPIRTVLGVENIEDVRILNEIQNYKEDSGNYDGIIALGSALMYDFFLTASYRVPRAMPTKEEKEELENKPVKSRGHRYFPSRRRRLF
jgi:hypothetical protein